MKNETKVSVKEILLMAIFLAVYVFCIVKIIESAMAVNSHRKKTCPAERGVAPTLVTTTDTASPLGLPHGGDAGQVLESKGAPAPEEKYDDDPRLIAKEPEPVAVVKIKKTMTMYFDVTNYNRWSDKKPGYRRQYANDDLTELPKTERILNEWHYTVALDFDMDSYHRALIRLPDGQWTHRYRFHVPGYNPGESVDENEPSEDYTGSLSWFNGKYFSVPRDRFRQDGRLDVLFTGSKSHVDWHATDWGKRFLPVEIWEIYEER